MKGTVNKLVRFVNIITDISQFFIDIYQFLYKHIYGKLIKIMEV
jgi:hypothetical protein